MSRAVSVLRVADARLWDELETHVPLAPHLLDALSTTERVVAPSFEKSVLPALTARGVTVLLRYARRPAEAVAQARREAHAAVDGLLFDVRRVLHAAQHHALGGLVRDVHAWDPERDTDAVRALLTLGLMRRAVLNGGTDAFHLAADLPPPPPLDLDLTEAIMDETDDLSDARLGVVRILHDLAGLAAALQRQPVSRTHAGTLMQADARRIGRVLGDAQLATDGKLEAHPRWGLAMRALDALGAVSYDPIARALYVDLALDSTLGGDTAEAVDRLVHRLVEPSLHVIVPAVREAIRQAGPGAIDEMIFMELLYDQQRELVYPRWRRDDGDYYPYLPGESQRPYDERGWQRVETPMVSAVLGRLERLGLVRRAPGVFAGTDEGRAWARVADRPQPPIWVSSDLEIVVPPESLTPAERYQIERLCRCLARDVVDRYRLDRDALPGWLAAHTIDDALELLGRRSPAIPSTVTDTLRAWAEAAERIVLTRGVILDD